MTSEWKNLLVSELANQGKRSTASGPFGSNLVSRDYTESGVPVIRGGNMSNGRWVGGDFAWVSEDKAEELSANLAFPGEIVFTQRGTLGQVCLVPDGPYNKYVLSQSQMKLRVNLSICDPLFMLYQFASPGQQAYIDMNAIRVGVPHTNLGILRDTPCQVPPLAEQKAIAHILGTLDDKIELNRKTNETLEAMAKALFKSWFVDFDPVRAKAEGRPTGLPAEISDLFPDSFEDSELGEIPSGWGISCVNDLCEWVSSGGTPSRSRKDFWENGNIPWFKTGELNDAPLLDSAEKINELALGNSSCKYWEAGTILFAIYASPTVGRLGVLTESGTSNQAAAGLKAKGVIGTPFLRRTLLFSRDELQNIAVGAAQQNINVQILKDHKVVAPGIPLATVYSKTISPLDEQQICLAKSTRELCLLRDALLPKLISGEIRIPDAEKMLEEVDV
jgi:type I restriction enzyme S subunit